MGTIGNGEPLRILCLSSELLIQIRNFWVKNSFREESGILPQPLRQTLRSKGRCLAGREYMGHGIFLEVEFIHGGKCQTLEKLFVPWKVDWFERLREDRTLTASPVSMSDLVTFSMITFSPLRAGFLFCRVEISHHCLSGQFGDSPRRMMCSVWNL